jgi:hypothetical protein
MTDANLEGADLSEARLEGVNLLGARLGGVRLAMARFDESTVWPVDFDSTGLGAIGPGVQLVGGRLSERDWNGASLRGASLRAADLSSSLLLDTCFVAADLSMANLTGCRLFRADLSGASLRGAFLDKAYLKGANLSGADLSGAFLDGAYLMGANLSGADLTGASMHNVRADETTIWPKGYLRAKEPSPNKLTMAGRWIWSRMQGVSRVHSYAMAPTSNGAVDFRDQPQPSTYLGTATHSLNVDLAGDRRDRLLHLLSNGDLAAWPDLARDLERRGNANKAAEALALLHAQGHATEAAQWLARVTDTAELQELRASLQSQAVGWQVGGLRALALDLLSGAYRLIPAGSFIIGSPKGEMWHGKDEIQQTVEIMQPFLLKTTLVTQAEWRALMGDNPSWFKGNDRRPVEHVSWHDAEHFCDALSKQTGGAYRLSTEVEWECACRAGTTTARYGDPDVIAWYQGNAHGTTHPVGQKQPNAWGLYDMLGNVREWTASWYDEHYFASSPIRNPTGPSSGLMPVIRGGSYSDAARDLRSSCRIRVWLGDTRCDLGFRCAASVSP